MRIAKASLVAAAVAFSSCSNGASGSSAGSCDATTTEAETSLGVEARAHSTDDHEVWA